MACVLEYLQRAFDSGTDNYVYWSSNPPTVTPVATTPQYTGILSAYAIIGVIKKDIE